MSLYKKFGSDESIEKEGFLLSIWDEGVEVKFLIARAGGKNKAFLAALQAGMQPLARKYGNSVPDDMAEKVLIETVATHVVKGWENVEDRDGEELPYSPENAALLLSELPELFSMIWAEAQNLANFQKEEAEEQGKE